ncbi:probable pinoresinol-lariciresinol reductase 3 isoform X1 [Ziziphus jujuba]|uniref:Probable pinoresinol-lariciresinol reductase 3 isoform X1 n=1 Tax=Ziziphus jujuba TaxID=326968 RepID=A0ABM3IXS7_ZIZJJ|nr:probable pinoresinol-lariciresinol reductase 3 isoform X1 [Ziziphus jujuba]
MGLVSLPNGMASPSFSACPFLSLQRSLSHSSPILSPQLQSQGFLEQDPLHRRDRIRRKVYRGGKRKGQVNFYWKSEVNDMEKKSRVLVIGATGRLGRHLAEASLRFSHPTFALVRDSSFSHPLKSQNLQSLSNAGATLLRGSLQDEASLIEALKQVDVVICAISPTQALDQKLLIRAIKQVGCIKRFIPSEFGLDPDKVQVSGMHYNFFSPKAEIRRLVEEQGIPYTFVSCNFFMSYLLPSLVQPGLTSPPRDQVTIFGHGNTKGVFVQEKDIASFTIRAVDDPRTLNKVLHLRPPGNVYSMNELVGIWETKIAKKLQKIYLSEQELLNRITETPYPENLDLIFIYSAFIKGDQTYFDVEASGGVEGTKLYPEVNYTTISEYLDTLL